MRIPMATYRVQFNRAFKFSDAKAIVAYLHDLGISDCYASPVLKTPADSDNGYDVCDHSQLNPVLGSEDDFEAFTSALSKHGLGLILGHSAQSHGYRRSLQCLVDGCPGERTQLQLCILL